MGLALMTLRSRVICSSKMKPARPPMVRILEFKKPFNKYKTGYALLGNLSLNYKVKGLLAGSVRRACDF